MKIAVGITIPSQQFWVFAILRPSLHDHATAAGLNATNPVDVMGGGDFG
jgi:hypothetical protein